jgi:hypothetical protein
MDIYEMVDTQKERSGLVVIVVKTLIGHLESKSSYGVCGFDFYNLLLVDLVRSPCRRLRRVAWWKKPSWMWGWQKKAPHSRCFEVLFHVDRKTEAKAECRNERFFVTQLLKIVGCEKRNRVGWPPA